MKEFMVGWRVTIVFIGLFLSLISVPASAAESRSKGLYVSPLHHEMTIDAGATETRFFTIANLTDEPMTVNLFVKQFSVQDYTYRHEFSAPQADWVKLKNKQVRLSPNQSQKALYEVVIPEGSAAGGYYYSLFAATTTSTTGGKSTVQAATLLYLTVDGDEATRSSVLQNEKIPTFVTESEVRYEFDVKNTGNTHFDGYFYARLDGLFGKHAETGVTRMLLPGTTREFKDMLSSPLLPGIYQLTYGYKVASFPGMDTEKTATIIFIPPWSVVALLLVILTGKWLWQKRQPAAGRG